MEYAEYNFKKRMNFHDFKGYLNLAEEIRKYFPKSLRVEQLIDSLYGKGKKKANVEMTIRIYAENGKDKEKFKEVKLKLEEILDCKLDEKKI